MKIMVRGVLPSELGLSPNLSEPKFINITFARTPWLYFLYPLPRACSIIGQLKAQGEKRNDELRASEIGMRT